jgi:hypothetical protein
MASLPWALSGRVASVLRNNEISGRPRHGRVRKRTKHGLESKEWAQEQRVRSFGLAPPRQNPRQASASTSRSCTATAKSPAKRGDSEQNEGLNGPVRSLDSISSNGIAQTCRPFCRDVHRPASPVAFVPALEFTDESGLHRAKYEFRSKRRGIGAFRRYRLVSACRSWEWRRRTGLEKGHRVSYLPFGRGYRCGGPYSSPGPSVLCRG